MRALTLFLFALASLTACGGSSPAPGDQSRLPEAEDAGPGEVPRHTEVVAFVMARCPHSAELMKVLIPLLEELGPAVPLAIGYLGPVDDLGDAELVQGDAEVAAAEMQICASGAADGRQWLEFLECHYEDDAWRSAPSGWTGCARRAGLDVEAIRACIESGAGREDLERSIAAAAESGIAASPTLFIGERPYLGPRKREALLTHICYQAGRPETRPAPCRQVDAPSGVGATLLVDERCDDPQLCDVSREVEFISMLVPDMEIVEVDYSEDEGRAIHRSIARAGGPATLPLLVLDEGLADWPGAIERMEEFLMPFGDGYLIPLGRGWDPTAEICDNGEDDNGDGLADCDDPGCAKKPVCREEQPGRLDLFAMSGCPFASEMMPSVRRFLEHLGGERGEVDFRLQFIGEVLENGELYSMHGPEEVAEDLRMICAQDLYSKKDLFMDYVVCRSSQALGGDWESCLPDGISARRIRRCAEGERGRQLLVESFELADAVGVEGSPTWMLNNRLEMRGRTAPAILESFCGHNDLEACDREVEPVPGAEARPDMCL